MKKEAIHKKILVLAVAFALFVNATAVSKAARKTAFIKASKTSIKTKKWKATISLVYISGQKMGRLFLMQHRHNNTYRWYTLLQSHYPFTIA